MPDHETEEDYKALQKQASRLGRLLAALTKARLSSAAFPSDLEKALGQLPSDAELAEALAALRTGLQELLDRERAQRVEGFGLVEAEYVRNRRSEGGSVRQLDEASWSIDGLEVQLDRTQLRSQVRYNHQVLNPWVRIASADDLLQLELKARKRLDDLAIPPGDLPSILKAALKRASEGSGDQRSSTVPILTFLREIRIELVRRDLAGSNPGKRLKHGEYPLWALLHNLDRYRGMLAEVPEEQRIGFETGSQQEQSRGMGVSLQGPGGELRTFCYMRMPRSLPGG